MQYLVCQMQPVSIGRVAYRVSSETEYEQMGSNSELSERVGLQYLNNPDEAISQSAKDTVKEARNVRWWLRLAEVMPNKIAVKFRWFALCAYWRMANNHLVLCGFTYPDEVAELEKSMIIRDGC